MDVTLLPAPPAVADLKWDADITVIGSQRFNTAMGTPAWWDLYNMSRPAFRKAGFTVERYSNGWRVSLRAGAAPIEDVIATVAHQSERLQQRLANMPEDEKAKLAAEEEQRQRRAEWNARQRVEAAEREEKRRERVANFQALAKSSLQRWGRFTVKHARMIELSELPDLTYGELEEIGRLFSETHEKGKERQREYEARDLPDPVTWPDASIVRAIKFLTDSDGDRATERNDAGWSSSDSSTGHWLRGMMGADDDLVLRVGRSVVGKYRAQIEAAMPDFDFGEVTS